MESLFARSFSEEEVAVYEAICTVAYLESALVKKKNIKKLSVEQRNRLGGEYRAPNKRSL